MDSLTPWLTLASLALALVALALWLRAAGRAAHALERAEGLEQRLAQLRRDLEASTAIGVRAGERLRRLEQAVAQSGERLGQLELRGEGRQWDQAIALVRDGADPERLIRHFGLTRGEAELVARLHGGSPGPGAEG